MIKNKKNNNSFKKCTAIIKVTEPHKDFLIAAESLTKTWETWEKLTNMQVKSIRCYDSNMLEKQSKFPR